MHEKNPEILLDLTDIVSVNAIITDAKGRLLMVQKWGDSESNGNKWKFVGGAQKKDKEGRPTETLQEALVREVYEETGLVAEYTHPLAGAGSRIITDGDKYQGGTVDVYYADIPIICTSYDELDLELLARHQDWVWLYPEQIRDFDITEDTAKILELLDFVPEPIN